MSKLVSDMSGILAALESLKDEEQEGGDCWQWDPGHGLVRDDVTPQKTDDQIRRLQGVVEAVPPNVRPKAVMPDVERLVGGAEKLGKAIGGTTKGKKRFAKAVGRAVQEAIEEASGDE